MVRFVLNVLIPDTKLHLYIEIEVFWNIQQLSVERAVCKINIDKGNVFVLNW